MKRLEKSQKNSFLKKMSRICFDAAPAPVMVAFGLGSYLLIGAAVLIIIFAVVKIIKKIDREKRTGK